MECHEKTGGDVTGCLLDFETTTSSIDFDKFVV